MKNNVAVLLKNYLDLFPEESNDFNLLKKQMEGDRDIFDRKNFVGHVTSSGLVISADKKILVIFHNQLQIHLQPGGHIESTDQNIISSAEREVREETNLTDIDLHDWCFHNNSPIYVSTHEIPESKAKKESAHFHHDFVFIFNTLKKDIFLDRNEVSNFSWVNANDLIKDNSNLSKALRKTIALNLI